MVRAALAALAGLVLGSPLIATKDWIADSDEWRRLLPAEMRATLTDCERPTPPPEATRSAAADAFYARHMARAARDPAIAAYARAARVEGNDAMYRAMWGPTEFTASGTLKDYDGMLLLRTARRRACPVPGGPV
ncbi:hypothetical protein AB5I41_21335 [Sphingomonas sp. MMS24-JH45]